MTHPDGDLDGFTKSSRDRERRSTSPQSHRMRAPDDKSSERKRSIEEISSQRFMAPDSALGGVYGGGGGMFPPAAAPPFHAGRSGPFVQEQYNVPPVPSRSVSQTSVAGRKTSAVSSTADDDMEPTSEEFARMSRTERKRYREKKRRSEVNRGFEDLMALLLKVDPSIRGELGETVNDKQTRRHHQMRSGENENPVLNRVELIGRAVTVLERMSRQNEQQKAIIEAMSKEGGLGDIAAARRAIRDDRVLLMIPFLSPAGPVISGRQPTDTTTFSSQQQQGLGLQAATAAQNVAAMRSNVPTFRNMPFPAAGYPPSQPADALQPRFTSSGRLQGYEGGFDQGYYQAMQGSAHSTSGVNPGDLQDRRNS